MSSRENPSSPAPAWTYRMEVSPTGQEPAASIANPNDPILLLHLLANLQNQTLELQRQTLEMQRQQLEISRELLQVNREQRPGRGRAGALAGRPRAVLETCRETLGKLEQVHAALMGELANLRRGEPREPARRRLLAQRFRRPLRPPAGPPQHDARRAPSRSPPPRLRARTRAELSNLFRIRRRREACLRHCCLGGTVLGATVHPRR